MTTAADRNLESPFPVRICPDRSRSALEGALALFQLLESLGPVAFEELRQSPVGEELAARLADRAIVRLVLGVDDPLHGRAADGTGLPIAAVYRHPLAKRSDLLGKR